MYPPDALMISFAAREHVQMAKMWSVILWWGQLSHQGESDGANPQRCVKMEKLK